MTLHSMGHMGEAPTRQRNRSALAAGPLRHGVAALAACAALGVASGCSANLAVAPEPDQAWARAALVPTFTALPAASSTITPLPSGTPTFVYATSTPDAFEAAGPMVRLEIPAIGVDSAFEVVGRLPNGAMDVPKVPANVAWFEESALPGQPTGRASVVAGHLDSPLGPAVFFDLRKLVPGDEMAVTYANGDRHVFTVTRKERYVFDQMPLDRIFGSTPSPMMNLITCDGAWDGGQANYQQRLVIYTRLKASTTGAS